MEPRQNRITNVLKVWDNGIETPFDPSRPDLVEYHDSIRSETGAKFGVATKWTFNGSVHQDANSPVPIPDMSGLVYTTAGWKQWVVLNPDGTIRSIIDVPRVNENSAPEVGYLGDPLHDAKAPLHIMYGEGSDGCKEGYRFTFDMNTCKLLRADFIARHW
jgi:hypothetical protein